jgi:hypothetical protein
MPTRLDRLRTACFWLALLGMPAMSLVIVNWPFLLVPGILIYGGLLLWLRPRSE